LQLQETTETAFEFLASMGVNRQSASHKSKKVHSFPHNHPSTCLFRYCFLHNNYL